MLLGRRAKMILYIRVRDKFDHPKRASTDLLAKANSGTTAKGEKDKWIWCEVLVEPMVEKTIRVEFQCFVRSQVREEKVDQCCEHVPSGPQRSA